MRETGSRQQAAGEFLARVQAAAAGTPYVVRPTRAGFDVSLDVSNARWWTPLQRQGVRRTFVHHVALGRRGKWYSITDDAFEMDWSVGAGAGLVPQVGARIAAQAGRIANVSFGKTAAIRYDGASGPTYHYSFSSEEGRQLITAAAKELRWSQRPGTAEKIGIAVGVLGLAVAVLTVVLAISLR
jgi:hypothetical protein